MVKLQLSLSSPLDLGVCTLVLRGRRPVQAPKVDTGQGIQGTEYPECGPRGAGLQVGMSSGPPSPEKRGMAGRPELGSLTCKVLAAWI